MTTTPTRSPPVQSDDPLVRHFRTIVAEDALAHQLCDVGRALRARTVQEGIEYGATFDLATGAAVGGILSGGANDVDFTPHAGLLRRDHTYVSLHTHPDGRPPAQADLGILVAHLTLQAVIAIGREGTWYFLSRHLAVHQADLRTAGETYGAVYTQARLAGRREKPRRGWSDEQTFRVVLHTAMRIAAPRLGLRYDLVRERANAS